MALKSCPDCQSAVSPKARACPHCGRPHPAMSTWRWLGWIALFPVFMVAVVPVCLALLIWSYSVIGQAIPH